MARFALMFSHSYKRNMTAHFEAPQVNSLAMEKSDHREYMDVALFHSDLLRSFPKKKTSCYFTVHICTDIQLLIDFLTVFELMYSQWWAKLQL
jgi:hypothetical protein